MPSGTIVVSMNDLGDHPDVTETPVAVRHEQVREGRVLGVVRGEQQFAVRRQRHFVDPRGAAGAECVCLMADALGASRSITLSVLSPSPA